MPGVIGQAEFASAFDFARSETASCRDAAGAEQLLGPDLPRFDHDEEGAPLGLLITAGADLGGGDRAALDPLMLPEDLLTGTDRAATVFHMFDPGTGPVRRAWYSRNALATVNALLDQAGHHLAIGVVPGFRPREDDGGAGIVRYRGQAWTLPGLLGAPALTDGAGSALIIAGAEPG